MHPKEAWLEAAVVPSPVRLAKRCVFCGASGPSLVRSRREVTFDPPWLAATLLLALALVYFVRRTSVVTSSACPDCRRAELDCKAKVTFAFFVIGVGLLGSATGFLNGAPVAGALATSVALVAAWEAHHVWRRGPALRVVGMTATSMTLAGVHPEAIRGARSPRETKVEAPIDGAVTDAPPASPTTMSEREPRTVGVGFWLRALARGLDLVVHGLTTLAASLACGVVLMAVVGTHGGDAASALRRFAATTPWSLLAAGLGGAWMHVASEALHGSTIGKRLCGITVVATHGGPPGFASAVRRTIAFYLDGFLFGMPAADAMASSPLRQRMGDRWANTLVVRIDSPEARPSASTARFLVAAAIGVGGDALIVVAERVCRFL